MLDPHSGHLLMIGGSPDSSLFMSLWTMTAEVKCLAAKNTENRTMNPKRRGERSIIDESPMRRAMTAIANMVPRSRLAMRTSMPSLSA